MDYTIDCPCCGTQIKISIDGFYWIKIRFHKMNYQMILVLN